MKENNEEFHPLINQSLFCLQAGYFEGVLHRSGKLRLLDKNFQRQNIQIDWLARVYLGGENLPSEEQTKKVRSILEKSFGGEGIVEYFLLTIEQGRSELSSQLIEYILSIAYKQNGQLIYHHPTALLKLAEISLKKLENKEFACKIINICLNYRGVYTRIDDIQKLAEMLILLKAPVPLWADWTGVFLRHCIFSAGRPNWIKETLGVDSFALKWADEQQLTAQKVLQNVIPNAPVDLVKLMTDLSPQMDLSDFVESLLIDVTPPTQKESISETDPIWVEQDILKLRYFWFDMILDSEQNFVRNGDWALFHSPTEDYSMGLAQWWRVLEAILKRSLANPLLELFLLHPEWVEMDKQNLSEKLKKSENIFLEKLTNPEKTKRLTLGELVVLLKKCVYEDGGLKTHPSKLRTEATHLFYRYKRQIHPLKISNLFNPIHLNTENVNWFRNRSSHDEQVGILDASIGRFLAKRVLDVFFTPLIESYGFKARIVIPKNIQ
jgi:hypothetical protein